MKIYEKLQKAREFIKNSDLKKSGYNDYSKYHYYTPEQVDKLVQGACKEVKILDLFDLKKNEHGYYGELTLIDLEDEKGKIVFTQSTDIPVIKATNVTQQIGGAVTYTNRYMLMTAFDIVDNNLDFDIPQKKTTASKNTQEQKPWLNIYKKDTKDLTPEMTDVYTKMKDGVYTSIVEIRKDWAINKANAVTIEAWFVKLKKTA